MKLTRGQIRVFEEHTRKFVDTLECHISQEPAQEAVGDVTLRVHHIRITAAPDGKWWTVNEHNEAPVASGAIEPVTNDG
jgi:hypothetical protein